MPFILNNDVFVYSVSWSNIVHYKGEDVLTNVTVGKKILNLKNLFWIIKNTLYFISTLCWIAAENHKIVKKATQFLEF